MDKKHHDLILRLLSSTSTEVLDFFASMHKSSVLDHNFPRYCYLPGNRSDRVLIVCHADTVWGDYKKPEILLYQDRILYAKLNQFERNVPGYSGREFLAGPGIGADDRAGCAMATVIWETLSGGHSLLITGEEEITLGPELLGYSPKIREIVMSHQYAIELDRYGFNQAVFYNGEPREFKEFITKGMDLSKYKGTYTDIVSLCAARIHSVNISVGYYNQHTPQEYLDLVAWEAMLKKLLPFLKKEQPKWHF